jgi:hypothetical protein
MLVLVIPVVNSIVFAMSMVLQRILKMQTWTLNFADAGQSCGCFAFMASLLSLAVRPPRGL